MYCVVTLRVGVSMIVVLCCDLVCVCSVVRCGVALLCLMRVALF